jgi:hypothetical protein
MDDAAEREEGGESVCWAHLVCPDCGAISSEGHRAAANWPSRLSARPGRTIRRSRLPGDRVRPTDADASTGQRQTAASTASSGRGIRSGSIASVSSRA